GSAADSLLDQEAARVESDARGGQCSRFGSRRIAERRRQARLTVGRTPENNRLRTRRVGCEAGDMLGGVFTVRSGGERFAGKHECALRRRFGLGMSWAKCAQDQRELAGGELCEQPLTLGKGRAV